MEVCLPHSSAQPFPEAPTGRTPTTTVSSLDPGWVPPANLIPFKGVSQSPGKENIPRHEFCGNGERQLPAATQGNTKFSPKVEYKYIFKI